MHCSLRAAVMVSHGALIPDPRKPSPFEGYKAGRICDGGKGIIQPQEEQSCQPALDTRGKLGVAAKSRAALVAEWRTRRLSLKRCPLCRRSDKTHLRTASAPALPGTGAQDEATQGEALCPPALPHAGRCSPQSCTSPATSYLILLPVFMRIHCGMGRFCFCFLARNRLILKVLWDDCGGRGREREKGWSSCCCLPPRARPPPHAQTRPACPQGPPLARAEPPRSGAASRRRMAADRPTIVRRWRPRRNGGAGRGSASGRRGG